MLLICYMNSPAYLYIGEQNLKGKRGEADISHITIYICKKWYERRN